MKQIGTFKQYEEKLKNGMVSKADIFVRFDSKVFEFTILKDGSHILELTNSKYINSKMGDWLKSNGLEGLLFISSGNGPGRNADKWIERFVNTPPEEWRGDFTIWTLEDLKPGTDPHIKSFPRTELALNTGETDKALQELYGDKWDGFIIRAYTANGLLYFRKLPNRQARGTIVAIIPDDYGGIDGVMVEVWRDQKCHYVKAMGIPLWLRQSRETHETYVGKTCIMTYTQYVAGDRVANFTSPRVISVSKGVRHGTK